MWNDKRQAVELAIRRQFLKRLRHNLTTPKVLANSIPKSGTHLLTRCLSILPDMTHSGFIINYKKVSDAQIAGILDRVGNGCFVQSHLPYSEERFDIFSSYKIKTLLMIRDPRDVVVSHVNYATYTKQSYRFLRLPDDDSRLMLAIRGDDETYGKHKFALPNIYKRFTSYLDWVDNGSYLVRFEDLVGRHGGGDDNRQYQAVCLLADYLDIQLTDAQAKTISGQLFYRKSKTFHKGVIGGWRTVFTEAHKAVFKEIAGQLLIDLGYENDLNW